jgi:2-amino-4-hydroxy-6-hydroxymethyldihydropteridine diphosphokinase
MHSVYLLTGSNLGNRLEQLEKAVQELEQYAGIIEKASSVFETEAWGKEGLPSHLNQALHLKTILSPFELLKVIHSIEEDLGRIRQEKWGVRMIDIDIIYFDDLIIASPTLQVPHPLMQVRNFVLQPLCEIAPDFVHPVLMKTNKELLQLSKDHLAANLFV